MADAQDFRRRVRQGQHRTHTTGEAFGLVQCNVVILPAENADDFTLYCQRNPKPCPLVARADPGQPMLDALGLDIDIRSDVPRYRIFRRGALVEERDDIFDLWRDDFVTFAIGCSFSFEEALIADGLTPRHIALGRNCPMYRTTIPTAAAGRFSGPLVVTMRPYTPADAIRAVQITSRFPGVHGAPIHFGDPAAIGIQDLEAPDFGDPVPLEPGEIPVFWACGVTPQIALQSARPEICITHAPGHMLVTDLQNSHLAVF